MKNLSFDMKMFNFYLDEEKKAEQKCQSLAEMYFRDFQERNLSSCITISTYITQCKHMVTVFLFQPPYYACENKYERDIYHEEFKKWNPTTFVLLFCKKLDEKFKK